MPEEVRLRPALVSDLDAILELERGVDHAPHWPLAAYSAILEAHGAQRCMFVARTDEALAGFAVGLVQAPDADSVILAELESVVVAEKFRRAGIGRALCNAVIEWCRMQGANEIDLEVRSLSAGAICLYTGLGFVQTGRRPRYYREPEEDAVIMSLRLEAHDLYRENLHS